MRLRFTILAFLIFFCLRSSAQKFPVDTIYKAGPINNRVNIVILGDGFTQDELPRFASEARKFADFFLSYSPYDRYRNYFNIVSIGTPSKDSGITNPGSAIDAYPDQPIEKKDTYFGSSFGPHIHRLVTITNYSALSNVLATNFPSYDLVVILANSPWYGGSGGSFAVHTLDSQANKIGVHEIGHTLTHLNDEYWAGSGYGWEAPNMTENNEPGSIKWKNWLNEKNVGIFRHGEGEASHWFKPTSVNCLMEVLNKEFCNVCREATVERILDLVSPVERYTPDNNTPVLMNQQNQSFTLELLKPDPNSLSVEWSLDGRVLRTKAERITIPATVLRNRITTLTATIFDSTFISKQNERHFKRTKQVTWKIEKKDAPLRFRILASKDSVCAGQASVLTALGCPGSIIWSTGERTEIISVRPSGSTSYSATCRDEAAATYEAFVKINVNPNPKVTASNDGPYFEGATVRLKSSANDSYSWTGPNSFESGLQNPSIENAKITDAGLYEVEVTSEKGCKARSQTKIIIDPVPTVDSNLSNSVQVFPNPTKDLVYVKVKLAGVSEFALYDMSGRAILRKSFNQATEINLKNLVSGNYIYRLSNGNNHTSGKLLLE